MRVSQIRSRNWRSLSMMAPQRIAKHAFQPVRRAISQTTQPDIVLVGDSHAHHFYPGLAEVMNETGKNLALISDAGCPPFLNVKSIHIGSGNDWCHARNDYLSEVRNDPNIDTVVLAANWHLYAKGYRFSDFSMDA